MSSNPLAGALTGVGFTTATPFTDDGNDIHEDALRSQFSWLEESGAECIIPCGNTGEYYALSHEERLRVVDVTVSATSPETAVIAGAGGSVATVAELAAGYADAGVDGLLLMDVDHTYVHQRGLFDYYEAVATSTPLDIVLYQRSDRLPIERLAQLARIENVVGMKFAMNDISRLSKTISAVPEEFIVMNGIAERFAPTFALEGAPGFTTGIGGVVPDATLALHRAISEQRWERAKEIRDLLRPLEDLREESGTGNRLPAANNVPAVKYAMDLAGQYGGPVRPPLVELSAEDKRRVDRCYERIANANLGDETS